MRISPPGELLGHQLHGAAAQPLYNTYASVYSRLFSMVLYDLKRMSMSSAGPTGKERAVSEKRQASIIIKASPCPEDIAILKIETMDRCPVLPLAGGRAAQGGGAIIRLWLSRTCDQ